MKKKLVLILILLGSINMFPQSPIKIQQDKVMHFVGSYTITNASYEYFQPIVGNKKAYIYSSAIALSVGLGKEIYDKHTDGTFSPGDVIADISGILFFRLTIKF